MTSTTREPPVRLSASIMAGGRRRDYPRAIVFAAAASMVVLLMVVLGYISWNGIQLFTHSGVSPLEVLDGDWRPYSESDPSYGILPFVLGTVAVTAVAILIAAPIAVGLALFLADVAPAWARRIVQPALEVFVGVPSVVWGWLGITILVPWLRSNLSGIGFNLGFSWLAGSLVLTIMILPTITAVSFDSFQTLPSDYKTASLALGATRWQTMRRVLIPAAMSGVLTAVVLGLARAAGEALAVQMVIGNRPVVPTGLTQPLSTLTSQITMDMGNTVAGEPWNEALWTMALVLLLLSLGFVLLIRLINARRAR
jgi:phosphate transport system permease protein